MHQPQQQNQAQQVRGAGPPLSQQQPQPQPQPQQLAPPMAAGVPPPALFASNSFGSASSPPSNVNLQLQQAAPLSSSSFHIPSPRQGGEKRGRSGNSGRLSNSSTHSGRLSNSSTHSAPPMMPIAPLPPTTDDDEDDSTPCSHESSTKKRRAAGYVAPRAVPTTFTSVTTIQPGPGGLRRNLSFSRIDPYVSYAQTPSLVFNNNTTTSDRMDMDASSGNQSASGGDPQSRVRSMSF